MLSYRSFNYYFIVLSFAILIPQNVWAFDFKNQWSAESNQVWTSDGFNRRQLSAKFNSPLSDITWPYSSEPNTGISWGGSVLVGESGSNDGVLRKAEFKLSRYEKISTSISLTLDAGLTALSMSDTADRSSPLFMGKLIYYKDNVIFNLELSQNNLTHLILGNLSRTKNTDIFRAIPIISWMPSARWKITTKVDSGWLSDGNHRNDIDASALYGVSTDELWIWIGPGIENLDYRFSSPGYWSPQKFSSIGMRADCSFPIIEKLRFTFGGSAHQIKENDFSPGNGSYLNAGLSYGTREDENYSFNFESIKSEQSGGSWSSTAVNIAISIPSPF